MTVRDPDSRFTIRTHRPGDLGYIVFRHSAVYSKEFKYGPGLEAIVARIAADFLDNFDEARRSVLNRRTGRDLFGMRDVGERSF